MDRRSARDLCKLEPIQGDSLGSFIFGAFNILKFYIPKNIVTIPEAIFDMLPFLVTAIVLIVTSIRKSKENTQPAGCGINYFREER